MPSTPPHVPSFFGGFEVRLLRQGAGRITAFKIQRGNSQRDKPVGRLFGSKSQKHRQFPAFLPCDNSLSGRRSRLCPALGLMPTVGRPGVAALVDPLVWLGFLVLVAPGRARGLLLLPAPGIHCAAPLTGTCPFGCTTIRSNPFPGHHSACIPGEGFPYMAVSLAASADPVDPVFAPTSHCTSVGFGAVNASSRFRKVRADGKHCAR